MFILSKAGKLLAKLVPFCRFPGPRQPGGWEGQMRISEDFDDPLPPEIQAAFTETEAGWLAEIERRGVELESGAVQGISCEDLARDRGSARA